MKHYSRDTKAFKSLPYNPKLKKRAQELRRAGNLSEVLLWLQLKQGKLLGLDFDRQKIIGNYIVDFFCAQKSIVIEVDGSSHNEKIVYDTQRELFLTNLGLSVIHINDADVKTSLDGVMKFLKEFLTQR